MTDWRKIVFSALVQLVITAGTALIAGATNDGIVTNGEWVVAVAGGLVAAAKDAQAYLARPPTV
jgi:hypothetical protein